MDTIKESDLLSARAGFKCSTPAYLPTYKLHNPEACKSLDEGDFMPGSEREYLKECFFPDGVEMKGEEIQLGWLDRTCWLDAGSTFVDLASERRLVFGSDHAAVETIFQID